MHEDLCFRPVSELSKQIASRKLSPVELTRAYLERTEELDEKVKAVLTVTKEHALQRAAAVEQEIRSGRIRGPLHGIPYGVKDLLDTKGIRTTGGSTIFKDRVPDRDAAVVERLNGAGAIMISKLALMELASGAYNDAFSPQPRNPWKLDRQPAGSSSGSGVATAAAMVAFSIGSDTLGSIMGPSGANGVSGIRPTYSRVSRYGDMTLAWSLDRLGPLARSAMDLGLVLEVIAGPDSRDPTSNPTSAFRFRRDPGKVAGRKIGVIRAEFDAVPPANQALFAKALDVFKQGGFVLEDVALPNVPTTVISDEISRTEAGAVFKSLFNDKSIRQYTDQIKAAEWMASSMLPASDYMTLQRVRALLTMKADEMMAQYSAVIAPNNAVGSRVIQRSTERERPSATLNLQPRLASLCALAGLPGLGIPCGFDVDGMPLGLHIAGRAWGEQAMLDAGMAFQKETDFHLKRPEFRS
jgi:aspartyl-tRNA(Asn)/glutamyl-tRNA(Gln) amidotransferase subunit A